MHKDNYQKLIDNKYRKNDTKINDVLLFDHTENTNEKGKTNDIVEEEKVIPNERHTIHLLKPEIEEVAKNISNDSTKDLIALNSTQFAVTSPNQEPTFSKPNWQTLQENVTQMIAAWSQWQPWTECSRNCGGGVMSQTRECTLR